MLPQINIIFDVFKLVDVEGRRNYNTTASLTNCEGYIYQQSYQEAVEFFEIEGVKNVYRIITEQSGINENDKIKSDGKEYKVLRVNQKNSSIRNTFYQIVLSSTE